MAPPDIINSRNPTKYGLMAGLVLRSAALDEDEPLRPNVPLDWYLALRERMVGDEAPAIIVM